MHSLSLFSQIGAVGSVGQLAITLIVVLAIVAIVFVVLRQAGIVVPAFVVTIGWIVLAVFLGVFAIRFLMGS